MTTCSLFSCQREEQCDDCFFVDHLKECVFCEYYDHEEASVSLAKFTITDLAREMQKLIEADPFKAVYFKGKMISPTSPSSSMTF